LGDFAARLAFDADIVGGVSAKSLPMTVIGFFLEIMDDKWLGRRQSGDQWRLPVGSLVE
jgi:hypothetical protein